MPGQVPEYARRPGSSDRRTGAPAEERAPVLRSLSGPHPVRHRRHPSREGISTAALREPALRDLLPLSGNRRRVFRLRAGGGSAARAVAHLWSGAPGRHPAQGLPRQCRASAGSAGAVIAAVSAPAGLLARSQSAGTAAFQAGLGAALHCLTVRRMSVAPALAAMLLLTPGCRRQAAPANRLIVLGVDGMDLLACGAPLGRPAS